jgi:serine/threonine-protein kinase
MIPEKLGRYEIQAEIGQGAMGRVYRAFDPAVGRVVAIKAIKSEVLAQDPSGDYLKRFHREAQAVGGLTHPGIVSIFDVGENYFVMEYLEGTSLLTLLAGRGRFPLNEVLPIISPIADALDYAHRRGVIHRDIKPANIMIQPDGRPKVTDFGLAHLESTAMTTAGQFLGSPSYMSPEQVLGGKVTSRADVYSLAVVTYEMLTGKKPFPGDHVTTIIYRVVNEKPEPPRKWNGTLPPHYDDVFARALAKDPDERFATASDFIAALNLKEIGIDSLAASPGTEAVLEPESSQPGAFHEDETRDLRRVPGAPLAPAREGIQSITERKRGTGVRPSVRGAALAAAGVAVVTALGLMLWNWGGASPAPPLRVQTAPTGAAVWLDGTNLGNAPVELPPLEDGQHTIRLTLAGFESVESTFDISPEGPPPSLVFDLKPAGSTLNLGSEPEGASVKVDGQLVGRAPLAGHVLAPGPHQILVEQKGYRPWAIEVEAQAGEGLNLTARLTRELKTAPSRQSTSSSSTTSTAGRTTKEGDLVELGPEVTAPRKISGNPASYPPAAMRARLQGAVTIQMIVTERGEPKELKVVESAGDILDEAVLKAVREWRYEPGMKDGVKVKVRLLVRQSFRLGS